METQCTVGCIILVMVDIAYSIVLDYHCVYGMTQGR